MDQSRRDRPGRSCYSSRSGLMEIEMRASPTAIRKPLADHVELGIVSRVGGDRIESSVGDQITVTVGEMTQHLAVSNVPILSVQWQIFGGNAVAGYTVSAALGQVVPLTPMALVGNPLTFAFSAAGTWTVGVTITTAYGSGYVSHTWVVTAPQVNFFESQTATVALQTWQGQPWIMFGSPPGGGAAGITMNAVLFGQQSAPGWVGILQLATDQRFGTDADGRPYHNTQNGIAVLDVGPGGAYVFYQDEIAQLPVGGNAQVIVHDGPGSQLGPPFNFVAIGDGDPVVPESYQAFLMFCAASPGAIWVPLSVLDWSWEGFTQFDGSNWGPVQQPDNAVNPSGTPTNQFPTWTANTTTGSWASGAGMLTARR